MFIKEIIPTYVCMHVQEKVSMQWYSPKVTYISFIITVNTYAKQKHLGCKKVRGQSEVTCKQAGATKSFDIS